MAGCVALVVAAGRGTRLAGELPKQYLPLGGRPVLRHSLETFARHPRVSAVRAVIHADDRAFHDRAAADLEVLAPVHGGETRQDSARLGLESLAELAPDSVLIHDAARPLVSESVIDRVVDALAHSAGAIAALPVTDTLKRGADDRIVETVERTGLWRAQTPQGFRYPEILEAHRTAAGLGLTDDAAVAEHAGLPVALVMGSEDNLKVTAPEDLDRAARVLAGAEGEVRVGAGYDVHAFGAGNQVMLCGLAIPHDHGLAGHSDGDVGLHALTDAILGAIGAGDIGDHFSSDDPRWRGGASEVFLRHAARLVEDRHGRIQNVDVTLICEAPKIASHRSAMAERIAGILCIDPGRVSVKATTTDRLGFLGRGEGIAAQATATVRLPLGT